MQPQLSTDLLDAIYNRRAVRRYAPDQLGQADLERLIGIATQAPSALNSQPWAFAVIRGADRLKKYSERAKECLLAGNGLLADHARSLDPNVNIFHGAPALVIICATSEDEQAAEDCCLAAQTFMLAAFGYGYATCPIGFARPWLHRADTKLELGIPASWVPVFPVVIGVGAEQPDVHGRNPARISWL